MVAVTTGTRSHSSSSSPENDGGTDPAVRSIIMISSATAAAPEEVEPQPPGGTSPPPQPPRQRRKVPARKQVMVLLGASVLAIAALGRERNQVASLTRMLSSSTSTTMMTTTRSTSTRQAAVDGRPILPHVVIPIPDDSSRIHNNNNKKVTVVLWTSSDYGVERDGAATKHIWWDGLQESPYLDPIVGVHQHDNASQGGGGVYRPPGAEMASRAALPPWVYIVGRATTWDVQCQRLCDRIRNAIAWRRNHSLPPASWPIHVVDYTDPSDLRRCREAEQLMGGKGRGHRVYYSKRSVVQGRRWQTKRQGNASSSWVTLGSWNATGPGIRLYKHIPFAVRTDTVETLQAVLQERGLTLKDNIASLIHRPVDVTHLWPRSDASERGGVGDGMSRLREVVSDAIWNMSHENGRNWSVVVNIVGSPSAAGRLSVATSYVETMLSTKIMVVAQRDNWEDHYRLMEALVTGALVFTDRMLSLPSGLANGTSIIEFGSLDELERLLDYYLSHPLERQQIAAEGRRVAMSRHRSWHRVEEVIFGNPFTVCPDVSDTDYDPGCPFVVHANESTAAMPDATASTYYGAASSSGTAPE